MAAPVAVILNAAAGGAEHGQVARTVCAALEAAGMAARIAVAREADSLVPLARRACEEGAAAVVAGGGDGTVSAVASVLAGTGVPLGVLPLGTLNHFAKDLGIANLGIAAAVLRRGRTVAIDAGEVNGRVFVNNSSLGLYPMVVRQRQLQQSLGRGRWPAFAWAAVTALRWYPFLDVRLAVDGKTLARRTPFVFIGNNLYRMEGLRIGSRPALDGGRMCVYVLHRTGRLGLLRLALSAVSGRLHRAANYDSLTAADLWIRSPHRRLSVALDGEVHVLHTPLHYRIRPGALRVIVP